MTGVRRVGTVLLAGLLPLILLAESASAASTASVQVSGNGYSPAALTVPYGTKVVWTIKQGSHTVTDTGRLKLFGSGTLAPGSTFGVRFIDAGTYDYHSTVGPAITGSVAVPTRVTPASGNRTAFYTVQWGSTTSSQPYSEQVQIKPPGGSWQSFVYGTVDADATMRPVDWGNRTGTYQFRAKLYRGSNPAVSSGWSPAASISVH